MCDVVGAETTEARAIIAFVAQTIWGINRQVIKR